MPAKEQPVDDDRRNPYQKRFQGSTPIY
jgi:hypothetical protein